MNTEIYETEQLSPNIFHFISSGEKGRFLMRIDISLISATDRLYNLGFGFWDEQYNLVDDSVEVRNGDTNKVLTTVGLTALDFVQQNPGANIMATGSVSGNGLRVRTRKYQMGISQHYEYLSATYNIYGLIAFKDRNNCFFGQWPFWAGEWYEFEKGVNYDAFMLNLK